MYPDHSLFGQSIAKDHARRSPGPSRPQAFLGRIADNAKALEFRKSKKPKRGGRRTPANAVADPQAAAR